MLFCLLVWASSFCCKFLCHWIPRFLVCPDHRLFLPPLDLVVGLYRASPHQTRVRDGASCVFRFFRLAVLLSVRPDSRIKICRCGFRGPEPRPALPSYRAPASPAAWSSSKKRPGDFPGHSNQSRGARRGHTIIRHSVRVGVDKSRIFDFTCNF